MSTTQPSPAPPYPGPWVYKGQAWLFLLSLSDGLGKLISSLTDHEAARGPLLGGPGTLSLYHYTESPLGAYDELSFSPGWYEYRTHSQPPSRSSAKRITKCYVSCGDREISELRRIWGLPAEHGIFNWTIINPNEFSVSISLPNGVNVIDMTIHPVTSFLFNLNTMSAASEAFDLGRLVPIVQPALDGHIPPLPTQAGPSPHPESTRMLKTYMSMKGTVALIKLKRVRSNREVFPPIEELHVLKWGLGVTAMELTHREAQVVLDTNQAAPLKSNWYLAVSNFIKAIAFEKVGSL
jgi:hypothetical protein